MMNARALGLLASLLAAAAPAAAQNGYPEWNGRPVQDLAEIIGPRMEDSLRTLLAPVRNQGVDLRVVTIPSMRRYGVGATTFEDFAQGLFNAWRVGDRPESDGVLLLVSTGERGVRIQLGDGALRYQSAAQQVVRDSILPHFREGNMVRGILRGAAGIAQWYTPAGQAAFAPPPPPPAPEPAYAQQPVYTPPPREASPEGRFIFGLLGVGGAGIGAAALGAYARNRPRKCAHCGTQMVRLDEASDDVYLDSGQKTEEFMQSVDYDIWKCGGCGAHTLLRYGRWFSGKSACPSCRYVTIVTTKHVLQYPTYDMEGREEVIRDCRHCGFHDRNVVFLPRRQRPSQSSSSSSSSWSSSDSSSSSSSFSSSSGGHSSGGGASGYW